MFSCSLSTGLQSKEEKLRRSLLNRKGGLKNLSQVDDIANVVNNRYYHTTYHDDQHPVDKGYMEFYDELQQRYFIIIRSCNS